MKKYNPIQEERKKLRLDGFDYSKNRAYYITTCTKNKECFFGKIEDDKMILNSSGEIAEKFWKEIPSHFLAVELDEFVIMPNHIHGILRINNVFVGEGHALPLHHKHKSCLLHKPTNLSTVIGSFKSAVSKNVREINDYYFAWQISFHDRIIRNELELNRIRQYIKTNPENWKNDENNLL